MIVSRVFCLRVVCRSKIYLHALRKSLNPSAFSSVFALLNSDNKSALNLHFLQACFDYARMFETSRFVCQHKVDARRFIGILYSRLAL